MSKRQLEQESERKIEEGERHKEKLSQHDITIRQFEEENERQEDAIKQLEQEKGRAAEEGERHKEKLLQQEITIRQLVQEKEGTEEEVKRLKENQSQQSITIKQLEEEHERQEDAIKQLEQGKGRAEKEVKLLNDKQSEAAEEGERHKIKLLQQENAIRQLVQEKEGTEEEVKRLKENQSQHTITIRQLEEENERKDITIRQLEEENEITDEEVKHLRENQSRKGTNVQIPTEEVDAMRIPEKTERSGKGVIGQEPEWNVAIDTENIAGMKKLVNDKKPPPSYNTFRRAVHILHDRTVLISLCRLVSEDILTLFDRTKIIKVYAATTDNKLDITFIVVSRCSVPVPAYNGYPVLVKNISNAVLEDKAVDDAVFQMSTSDKEKLKKVKQELKSNLPTLRSAIKHVSGEYSGCPNISQMTFSPVKARNFSYKDKTVYTVDCEPALCIVIYVYFKGWIPFGWESFPDTMGGYPTDVREFYELKVQVMTDLQCRTFPCYVYEIREITTQGLLGRQSDLSKYGLTCAHSLVALEKYGYKSSLSLDEDEDYVALDREDLKQMIPDINVRVERLVHGILQKPDENIEAFVDVAAVLINPQSDHLTVGLSRLINKAFEHRHPPQFHYSEADAVVHEGDIVLKFGNTTELTFGTIKEQETFCTRTPGFIHVLGAYEDETKTTRKPFSDNGDSGALVFKVNRILLTDAVLSTMSLDMNTETESEQLIPIGMVYGSPVGDETVTYCTQMTPCLKALGNEYTFLENQEI
ncbi:uncharacterized protein LOC128222232 [Mya arenaria]|uniref:uncharacterized protein LOC128222232 n=1 Tax=Mya arenaria TaxID=6604 RepID=UPI0022E3DF4A|nr:uncharacterized protein LOC128222232 [Mya arenaria]